MKKTHVLVTGGAGYIGSVLVPRLLQKGYRVTVVDNLLHKQATLFECFSSPNFHFVKGDVADRELMKKLTEDVDYIIPLAAIVGAPACDLNPSLSRLVNLEAIHLLLEITSQEQRILYPNTNSGYGIGEKEAFCTEESHLNPISLYGQLKVEGERAVISSGRGLAFRLATVFGISPRMRLDLLVNDFVFRACHDRTLVLFEEHFKRNYIHIGDVAEAFLFGIENFDKMKGSAYNLGLSDANLSKRELAEKIQKYIPSLYIHSAPIGKDPDQRNYIVSNNKIEKMGFLPKKTIDDGIREMIAAYPLLRYRLYSNV